MNVYDFDETIYDGDSSVDFWLFCARKNRRLFAKLPRFALVAAKKRLGLISKTQMKEEFFSFLGEMPATSRLLDEFWSIHIAKIKPFYLEIKQPDDVVISASPEFLLRPACRLLGIREPIASRVDPHSGRFDGENCRGEEKVVRFNAVFPQAQIENFYSDSNADAPMARSAKRAWRVKGPDVKPW